MRLTRFPEPRPDESALGYVIRLADAHICGRTSWAFEPLGIDTWSPTTPFGSAVELSQEFQDGVLRPLPRSPGVVRVLTAALMPEEVDRERPRVCPQCLAEAPYLRAVWELKCIRACPIHRVQLTSSCPACGVHYSWNDPSVDRCACGRRRSEAAGQPATEPEILLAGVIHGALGLATAGTPSLPSPIDDLSLPALFELLVFLARADRDCEAVRARPGKPQEWVADVERGVALALRWPDCLHRLLKRSYDQASRREHETYAEGENRAFGWVLRAIKRMRRSEHGKILADEAIRVVRSIKPSSSHLRRDDDFIAAGPTAERIGVAPKFLSKLLKRFDPDIPRKRVGKLWLYDRERVERVAQLLGRLLNRRALAETLAVNEPEATEFAYSGLVINYSNAPGLGCRGIAVDREEVIGFLERIGQGAVPVEHSGTGISFASLRQAAANRGIPFLDVVKLLADGQLRPIRWLQGRRGFKAFRFDLCSCREVLETLVAESAIGQLDTISIADAACLLGKTPGVVASLVRAELLEAVPGSSGTRFTMEAVDRFRQAYVDGFTLAQEFGVAPADLAADLEEAGIKPAAKVLGKGQGRVIWRRSEVSLVQRAA